MIRSILQHPTHKQIIKTEIWEIYSYIAGRLKVKRAH